MNKIKNVLFDFDGTLMDTNDVIIQSWQYTFRTIEGREEDEKVLLATFGEPLEFTINKFFGVDGAKMDEYVEIYRSYQREHFADDIKLFPGIMEMLEQLKSEGYTLALVTSRLRSTTMQGIEKFGIGRFFDIIITADDCTKHKPDPQPINITLEKLGALPEESVMLGDTVMDIGCARNAGVRSVLVGWSMALAEEEAAAKAAPDYIIESPSSLSALLKSMV